MSRHEGWNTYADGYDKAARDDEEEFKRLDAENAGLRGEAQRLRAAYGMLEICAATLAVHVLGHFAMASETSPDICKKWAEAVQKTIADNAVK